MANKIINLINILLIRSHTLLRYAAQVIFSWDLLVKSLHSCPLLLLLVWPLEGRKELHSFPLLGLKWWQGGLWIYGLDCRLLYQLEPMEGTVKYLEYTLDTAIRLRMENWDPGKILHNTQGKDRSYTTPEEATDSTKHPTHVLGCLLSRHLSSAMGQNFLWWLVVCWCFKSFIYIYITIPEELEPLPIFVLVSP